MRFDLRTLLRFVAIATMLAWAISGSSILGIAAAIFVVGLIGAFARPKPFFKPALCHSAELDSPPGYNYSPKHLKTGTTC